MTETVPILPSIVALVAGNFPVARRPAAYGLVAAAGAVALYAQRIPSKQPGAAEPAVSG